MRWPYEKEFDGFEDQVADLNEVVRNLGDAVENLKKIAYKACEESKIALHCSDAATSNCLQTASLTQTNRTDISLILEKLDSLKTIKSEFSLLQKSVESCESKINGLGQENERLKARIKDLESNVTVGSKTTRPRAPKGGESR